MLTILLMRSGRTAWETEGRIQGSLDIPLSPEGREEVKRTAEQVTPNLVKALFCGTDLVAVETAQIVGHQWKRRPKQIEDLREMNLGLWQGLLEQEVMRRNPTAYRLWKKNPLSVQPPAGESLEDCHRRVSSALRKLAQHYDGEQIALVCSHLVTGIVRCIANDVEPSSLQKYLLPPAATELLQFK